MTTKNKILISASVLSCGLVLALAAQQTGGTNDKWVPYSADYRESVVAKDAAGKVVEQKETTTFEKRAGDGAVMTTSKKNGQDVSARIWQADGKSIEISYAREQASVAGQFPRRHLGIPPGTPIGADTIAGLRCTVYPVHMSNGGGTVCVDVTDDIMVKEELNFESGGLNQKYLKEITAIDLTTPVNSSEFKVPAGFKVMAGPQPAHK
jgi:hypothetical protein